MQALERIRFIGVWIHRTGVLGDIFDEGTGASQVRDVEGKRRVAVGRPNTGMEPGLAFVHLIIDARLANLYLGFLRGVLLG
jgi:hypothetical protein